MYWLTGALLLLVMLGSLSAAELVPVPALPAWLMTFFSTNVFILLLCVLSLLFCRQLNQRHLITISPNSPKPFSTLWQNTRLGGLLLMILFGSALQALAYKQEADSNAIHAPMQVYALVQIEGISDSVGASSTDQGYRQVAQIRHITPVTALPKALSQYNTDAALSLLNQDSQDNASQAATKPARVLLSYYAKSMTNAQPDAHMQRLNALRPNETLVMRLALQPLDINKVSATGFDSYHWLKSRHIDGTATILDSSKVLPQALTQQPSFVTRMRATIEHWRWVLRQHRYVGWADNSDAKQQATAVALSLLTGDRSLITGDTKQLYQLAGISHLLAISGTHVLFLAIVLAGAVSRLIERWRPQLYGRLARWQVRWLVMMAAAFIYALFTGFDVPAARTAWLLLAMGLVRLTLLPISSLRVLLGLAVVMAWVDPFVLWQAGYWLSFVAVALLLQYETRQPYRAHNLTSESSLTQRFWYTLWPILRLQCWLFIALLPLTLLLFGKVSLWGLLVNVVMIGVFGWVLVPLNLLAGVLYPILPSLADSLWALLDNLLLLIHGFMDTLATMSASRVWLYTPLSVGGLCVALLVLLPWLLPRGLLPRGWSAPPLLLLVLILWQQQARLTGSPTLYVLPMSDDKLSATVLHYPHASAQATWLILADHRNRTARGLPSHVRQQALTQQLTEQIQSLGITRLTGIIVQTPHTLSKAPQDNAALNLGHVAQDIATRLPTQYYWQAGQVDDASSTTNTLPITPCHAEQTWQLPDGALQIAAVTGWTRIADDAVWDCSLSIRSKEGITLKRYNAQDSARPLDLSSANQGVQSIPAQTQLLLNASTQPKVWQLWSLLCPDVQDSDNHVTLSDDAHSLATLWLGHSSAAISPSILQAHHIDDVATYDDAPLAAAWTMKPQ